MDKKGSRIKGITEGGSQDLPRPPPFSTEVHEASWSHLDPTSLVKAGLCDHSPALNLKRKKNLLQKAVVMGFLVIDSVKLGMRLPFRVDFGTQRF